ncbi:MAG: hypothetical protein IJT12_09970 [Paludibacteraceae bacterium]|nr:hypothetical protein [Paludibacteraceae bacterium]
MNKQSLFVAFVSIIATALVACETNIPGSSENTSLPATARAILLTKPADAKQILRDRGYYSTEVDDMEKVTFLYPKELLSENENAKEKAFRGSWILIDCSMEETDRIATVWGEHYIPTASDAFDTFQQWLSYSETNVTNYDLHVVWIATDNSNFVFEEGRLFEEYKISRSAFYDDAYSKGQITRSQLDNLKKNFTITKTDLNQQISNLSASKEYDHHDIYIQLEGTSDYSGTLSMSRFDNHPTMNKDVPDQRMLEHRLQFTDVEYWIGRFLTMIEENYTAD